MAGDTERILEAVTGVRGEVVDVRDSVRCLDGKFSKLDTKVTEHLGEHAGQEKAESKAAKEDEKTSAKAKAVGAWVKIGLTALAMLVTALIFVLGIGGAADDEGPDETQELKASIDKLTQVVDKMADKAP